MWKETRDIWREKKGTPLVTGRSCGLAERLPTNTTLHCQVRKRPIFFSHVEKANAVSYGLFGNFFLFSSLSLGQVPIIQLSRMLLQNITNTRVCGSQRGPRNNSGLSLFAKTGKAPALSYKVVGRGGGGGRGKYCGDLKFVWTVYLGLLREFSRVDAKGNPESVKLQQPIRQWRTS